MNQEKAIDALNTLIIINNDRIVGYETASKETEETDLKTLFAKLTATSQRCKAELISEVYRLGGTPDEGTRTTGKFHRAWMDVKAALTGHDREAIVNSCEYGESVASDTYKDALTDYNEDLTSGQKAMLNAQHASLMTDYNTIKSLHSALELQK
jgi:uncharacterized protein (TIGR02284 family)